MGKMLPPMLHTFDGYSERDRGEWLGLKGTCVDCRRETIEEMEDGRCWACNHPEEAEARYRAKSHEANVQAKAALPSYLAETLRGYARKYSDLAAITSSGVARRGHERTAQMFRELAEKQEAKRG